MDLDPRQKVKIYLCTICFVKYTHTLFITSKLKMI